MQMAKGKKTKKQLKKIAKKVVKKMAKKSSASNKPLTADEQSKQIEMMKTILSRQPNPAMALDPQYRDLIQKNQQLNEMKNQKEYYLNSMKATIEADQERIKKMNQQEKELKDLDRDNKRKAALQKQAEKLEDKKEEAVYQRERIERKNEIGEMEKEMLNINSQIKRMQRDNERMEAEIKGKGAYNQLQQKKDELKDIQNQKRVLEQVMASDEFKQADQKLADTMLNVELEKLKLEQQREIYKRQKEIVDEELKAGAMLRAAREYKLPRESRPKKDELGHIIYKKDQQGQVMKDILGKPIPVMEKDPLTSEIVKDRKELEALEGRRLELEQLMKQFQEDYKMKSSMKEKIASAKVANTVQEVQLQALQGFNKKQEDANASRELSDQLKNELIAQANNELRLDYEKQRNKQLLEEQNLQRRSEYLNFREQQMDRPERIYEQSMIANKQIELDNRKRMNDLREQEIKAKELEQRHAKRLHTMNAVASHSTQISPETIGQVVAQINDQEEARAKADMPKVFLLNENEALKERLDKEFESQSRSLYTGMLVNSGLGGDVDGDSSIEAIRGANRLIEYALDHFALPEQGNAQTSVQQFVTSDAIKNFFNA